MNAFLKYEKMISYVFRRLKLSTMDNREENNNVRIEDKFRFEGPFEVVDNSWQDRTNHQTQSEPAV
jgi:hypothetical protein